MNDALPRFSLRRAAARLLLPVALAACADPTPTAPDLQAGRVKQPTVPGAPTNVSAVAGDARATVSWRAPRKDGGSAILSYRVTSSPHGRTATVTAPTTTATVEGLTNGTAYTFTVVATNAVGDSPASYPSSSVTPQGATQPPPDTTTPPPPPPTGRWVSGYYVGYQRDLYPVETVDFSVLTHLFVGRIIPRTDGTVATHFDINDTEGPAMAKRLAERAHQAGRKAVLMLGGAGEHAGFVGAASDANRAKFVTNLLATMDQLGYDGIDVDWEPIYDQDKAPLLDLLKRLRAARPNMILTIPVGWMNPNYQTVDPWYAEVAAVVDQMNIMSYYMAGAYDGWLSWHSSALAGAGGQYPSSVSGSAQLYLNAGIPKQKLGIGLGFFGMCWRGVTGPRQSGGWVVADDNTMSYRNIMASYHTADRRQWDAEAKVPYLGSSTQFGPAGCNFVSYDDEQSITEKGAYVRSTGLGGAIVWTIAQGHFPTAAEKNPLLKAAYDAIVP